MNPAQPVPNSKDARFLALEQAYANSVATQENTQKQINQLLQAFQHLEKLMTAKTSPPPSPKINTPDTTSARTTPIGRPPPPALPNEFDGDRSRGQAFLTSCQTYMRLCSDSFPSEQTKITWALSYMKSGRALKWAERIFQWEEKNGGYPRFLDWEEFRKDFRKDFCPAHSDVAAINKLESTNYYQKTRSVDDYLDEFVELVAEAGYTDPKTTVVKFRKGLEPHIQNTIATMAYGRPSDASPEDWYEAAKNIDQNRAANEAFKSAYRAPVPALRPMPNPVRPTSFNSLRMLPPTKPVPTDIDTSRKKTVVVPSCYKCGEPGHKVPDCPLRFDIRSWTTEELEMELMTRKDVAKTENQSEENSELVEDFVQDSE